jgi:hypothetical protein
LSNVSHHADYLVNSPGAIVIGEPRNKKRNSPALT